MGGESTRRPRVRLATLATLSLIAAALWRIAIFAARVPIAAPFQYDYEEGNILNALSRILHGATPYADPRSFPNVINPYGPAAYYLLAIPAKIFGMAFLYPRLMVLGCALAVAVLVGIEVRRASGSSLLAVAFGAVFLATPNIQHWMWLLRIDFLGLAFTTAGLVVFSRELHARPDKPRVFTAALLFAVALLVKLTFLAAPAACFTTLLARRRFRYALTLTGATAAIFAAVMLMFAAATHGAAFTDVFLSHPDPFSFAVFTQGLTQQIVASLFLVVLAVIAIAGDFAHRRFSPAVLWVVFATAGAVTAGKLGSNSNHFLEWNAALCVAAGIAFAGLLPGRWPVAQILALGIIAALVLQPGVIPSSPINQKCPQAYAWLRSHSGEALSENVGALVMTDHRVWVSNPFVLAQGVEHAGWSDAALVQMIRERRFDAIFTGRAYSEYAEFRQHGTERFSSEIVRALAENYVANPGFSCLDMDVLYRPRSSAAIQSNQGPGH